MSGAIGVAMRARSVGITRAERIPGTAQAKLDSSGINAAVEPRPAPSSLSIRKGSTREVTRLFEQRDEETGSRSAAENKHRTRSCNDAVRNQRRGLRVPTKRRTRRLSQRLHAVVDPSITGCAPA